MTKEKGQKTIYKTLHKKVKVEHQKLYSIIFLPSGMIFRTTISLTISKNYMYTEKKDRTTTATNCHLFCRFLKRAGPLYSQDGSKTSLSLIATYFCYIYC